MSEALQSLLDLLDLERIEEDISAATRAPPSSPGLRRAGGRPGAGRRRPHGPRGPARALPARVLPAPRRPGRPHRLQRRPPARRPLLHHPPRGRRPARQADLRSVGVLPDVRGGPRPPGPDAARTGPGDPPPPARNGCGATRTCPPRPSNASWRPAPPSTSATSTTRPSATSARPASRTPQVWFRTNGKLSDDPLLHVVLATYVSDMTLLDSVLLAHGRGGSGRR